MWPARVGSRGKAGQDGRPLYRGRRYEERCYFCNKCGHRNVVARWVHQQTGRVQIAPAWRGKCGQCGVYLGWQDKVFR